MNLYEAFETLCYAVGGIVVLQIMLGAVLAEVFDRTGVGTDKQEDDSEV